MKKSIVIISIILILTTIFSCYTYAEALTAKNIYDSTGTSIIAGKAGDILGIVQTIGGVASICVLVYIGIKWVISAPEEKAEIKKRLIPFFIGCVILTGGITIIKIVSAWASSLNNI